MGPKSNKCSCKRQKEKTQEKEGHVTMEAEIELMQPQPRMPGTLRTWKRQEAAFGGSVAL